MHRAARRMLMTRKGGYHSGHGGGHAVDDFDIGRASRIIGGYDGDSGDDPFSAYSSRVRKLESGGNPNAVTGHNYGLFQFGPEEMRKYGITDWRNEGQQYSGLRQEYDEHSRLLRQSGLSVTPENLYLMHQQGVGGAPALLSADPNRPAWQVLRRFYPSDAIAQKAVTGNIPSDNPLYGADPNSITAGQFVNLWNAKYNGQSGGGGGTQVASSVAPNPSTLQAIQSLTGMQNQGDQSQAQMAMGLLNKNPAQEYPYQPLTFPQVNLRHPADPDNTRTALQMINPQFQS